VVSAIGVALLFGFIFLVALIVGSAELLVASIVLVLGAVAALIFLGRHIAGANKRHTAKRSEVWAPYAQRIEELEQLIKKNREMVDDS
jgi:ABC-type uncharacterized transport system permease subunit